MPAIPFTGGQFAVALGIVGLSSVFAANGIVSVLGLPGEDSGYIVQVVSMSLGAAVLVTIPALRARTRQLLFPPARSYRMREVAAGLCAIILLQFALFGERALQGWMQGGDAAIVSMASSRGADTAFSGPTLRNLAITCLMAPLVEELVFRGFLFDAWRQQVRPLTAMLLSSAVFAIVHASFIYPFAAGLILCSVYARTGDLRAAILVHFVGNLAFWYPLLGQFVIPSPNRGIESWWLQLLALALLPLLIAVYALGAARSASRAAPAGAATG
jgi:membrane protease YdiL (CAAX protease family)